jgi:hypothetical protein
MHLRRPVLSEIVGIGFGVTVFYRKDIVIAFAPAGVVNSKRHITGIQEKIINKGYLSLVVILYGYRFTSLNNISLEYSFKCITAGSSINGKRHGIIGVAPPYRIIQRTQVSDIRKQGIIKM